MKKKYWNNYSFAIGFMVVVSLLIVLYFPLSSVLSKHLVLEEARNKGNIEEIKSINYSQRGRPYTIIAGTDNQGRNKIIWFDLINKKFSPSIVYSIYLDEGITKEDAIQITKKRFNIKEVKEAQLVYLQGNSFYENLDYSKPIAEGAYWWIEVNENFHIYVNFKSGEPYGTRFE